MSRKYGLGMALLSVPLVASAFVIERSGQSEDDYANRLRGNVGLSINCESKGDFSALPECRNAPDPTMVVWGDSFAMHLVPGIASTTGAKVMQATRSTCAPLLDFAFYNPPQFGVDWAEACIKFNQDVLKTIAAMPSIKVVVLAGQGSYFLEGRAITMMDGKPVEQASDIELASRHMRETVRALRSAGKRVVIIEPPPRQDFDIGRCIERSNERKIFFGAPSDCRISVGAYETHFANTLEFVRRLSDSGYINVYSFRPALCDAAHCETKVGDKIIYRDAGHFSYEGSIALAKKTALVSELERLAK